jgi:nucleoside-diphosphate-sugar epimerase
MNILITGIHGFVGSNLVTALKGQHILYGLDIVSPQKDGVVQTFAWNELQNLPPIDLVIHLAGKAHDTKNQTETQVYFDINTGLTKQVFDWFLTTDAQKFIFFSSVKAAADSVGDEILTEAVVPTPKGPYGESKLAAEQYLMAGDCFASHAMAGDCFASHAMAGDCFTSFAMTGDCFASLAMTPRFARNDRRCEKKVYILRPSMIHGPGNKGNLNLLYNVVKKGIPWPLGAFENRRSFTSVDNLCFVITQLVEKDIPAGIYNMADDESLSTNELIRQIALSQNRKAGIWKIPRKLIRLLANIGGTLHLPLNSERLRKLTESYVVSNQKIKQALNIRKMPVTAGEGFRKTFESFKK